MKDWIITLHYIICIQVCWLYFKQCISMFNFAPQTPTACTLLCNWFAFTNWGTRQLTADQQTLSMEHKLYSTWNVTNLWTSSDPHWSNFITLFGFQSQIMITWGNFPTYLKGQMIEKLSVMKHDCVCVWRNWSCLIGRPEERIQNPFQVTSTHRDKLMAVAPTTHHLQFSWGSH